MDIIEKLSSAGELTPEQVRRIRKNVDEFMKAAHADPEFHQEAMDKLGGPVAEWGKMIGTTVATGLALAGATEGVRQGVDFLGRLREKRNLKKSYEQMMGLSPGLKEYDKNRVQAAFATLSNFNPAYAKDPIVAGTFVQNAMDMNRIDVGTINALVSSRAQLDKDKKPFDVGAFIAPSATLSAKLREKHHPEQIAAWKRQGVQHPAQIESWMAQAGKAKAEGADIAGRSKAEIEAIQNRAAAAVEKSLAEADVQRARAKFYQGLHEK